MRRVGRFSSPTLLLRPPYLSLMPFPRRGRNALQKELTSKLFGSLGDVSLVLEENRGVEEDLQGTTAATSPVKGAEEPRARSTVPTQGAWDDQHDASTDVNVAKRARVRKLRAEESDVKLDGVTYLQRTRTHHKRVNQRTTWAELSNAGSPRNDNGTNTGAAKPSGGLGGLLQEGVALIREDGGVSGTARLLPQGKVEATRLRDANASEPSSAVIRSVQFHSNGSLLLTAGLDKTLRLFDVDGTNNPKVQSIHFDDLPIRKACFSGDGTQVVVAGRRKHFYLYNLQGGAIERISPLINREENSLESFVQSSVDVNKPMLAFLGTDGHISLVSLHNRSCVGSVKMNGTARSATFTANGMHLLTAGGEGTVYVWDLRNQRQCVERIVDEGALTVTSLAASSTGKHVSTGTESGVVNVYDTAALGKWSSTETDTSRSDRPFSPSRLVQETEGKPIRAIMNLTTSIDTLTFNGDGQMLAVSSRLKRDALRLVHIPTCTVFSNWPSSKTPLHYVWCTSFSPSGGYLAVGNARGRALLYRIHAYDV